MPDLDYQRLPTATEIPEMYGVFTAGHPLTAEQLNALSDRIARLEQQVQHLVEMHQQPKLQPMQLGNLLNQ